MLVHFTGFFQRYSESVGNIGDLYYEYNPLSQFDQMYILQGKKKTENFIATDMRSQPRVTMETHRGTIKFSGHQGNPLHKLESDRLSDSTNF